MIAEIRRTTESIENDGMKANRAKNAAAAAQNETNLLLVCISSMRSRNSTSRLRSQNPSAS